LASKFQYKVADVAQKLDILATHEPIILKNIDSKGHGECMIPIKSVIQQLRKEFILSVALERFGLPGSRIWRILFEKSKLDDRQALCSNQDKQVCSNAREKVPGRSVRNA
jgi:hypothetical protein